VFSSSENKWAEMMQRDIEGECSCGKRMKRKKQLHKRIRERNLRRGR